MAQASRYSHFKCESKNQLIDVWPLLYSSVCEIGIEALIAKNVTNAAFEQLGSPQCVQVTDICRWHLAKVTNLLVLEGMNC